MAILSQGGLCYDGQESLRKQLIRLGSLIDGITINHDHLRFLSDDTLGSNQRWEADSYKYIHTHYTHEEQRAHE